MRFEYAYVTWADLTDLTLAAHWDVWARQQEWSWLPPTQQRRFRCMDPHLYMPRPDIGSGMVTVPFKKTQHPHLEEAKPSWTLHLDSRRYRFFQWYMDSCGGFEEEL